MLSTMNLQSRYRTNDRSVGASRPRGGGKGFTLAEILIALGILAIGMSMVAAIFPAAMEFNRASTNSTLGTIICENGLALSERALTANIVDAGGTPEQLAVFADGGHVTHLTQKRQHYPTDTDESRTGFVMMARKVANTDATYQLVTVAYRKTVASNTVVLLPITCTISGKNITLATMPFLRIGTPLINRATGEFAFVDSINTDGKAGTLERSISSGDAYYVLVEKSGGSTISVNDMRRSPAIGAMTKMTGLKYEPPASGGS